jgi:ketopantoate reductase
MINILIIGVGKIGAYHLLSMINLRESCNIYLYDPCKNAIDNALEIFEDGLKLNPKKKKIIKPIVIFQLEDLPPIFDFCIISTSSKVRKGVLIALLRNTKLFIKSQTIKQF